MELVEAIDMKPERALAILLTYFKYRGPFLTYVYRGKDSANIIGRYDKFGVVINFISSNARIPGKSY